MIADNLYNSSKEVINRIELISGKRPEFFQVDVRKQEDFDKVFKAHPDIDSVIHFAALKVGTGMLGIEMSCRELKAIDYRLWASLARSPWSTIEPTCMAPSTFSPP